MNVFVLPDTQVRPGDSLEFLGCIGRYIVRKQPDVVVCLGDFADMPSLSSYDVGKKSFEGKRYKDDIAAARKGMETLLEPIHSFNKKAKTNGKKQYKPRMVLTLGNHEERIERAIENDAKLEGVLSVEDLGYQGYGWEVHDFLEVVVIEGIAFSHYFTTGVAGRPASTAQVQLNKKFMSCISGHQQTLQIATGTRADGKRLTSIIAGSCYEHSEGYLGPQGNHHFRGALMLYDVNDGEFNLVPIPLKYMTNKYA